MKITKKEAAILAYLIGNTVRLEPKRIKEIETFGCYKNFKHDPHSFEGYNIYPLFDKLSKKAEKK